MPGHTIKLHRVLRAAPERVYRAFTEPDAQARWLPPNGFTAKVYAMDVRVGGSFRTSFTPFAAGEEMFFGGTYLELVPNERLVYTDVFDDPKLKGEITVTVELKAVSCGTDLRITQAGVPEVIPEEMCYLGWQDSLLALARLVEG
jgi:uncharacterized protein YndB with AHSA1/START domain